MSAENNDFHSASVAIPATVAPPYEYPCGMIRNEPNAVYHASDSAGHTKLEVLRDPDRGPLRYFMQYVAKTLPPHAAADHFDVGSAFDTLLLEGESAFADRVVILPDDFNGRTNAGKAMLAGARATGNIVLDQDEYKLVLTMFEAVRKNPHASALLTGGQTVNSGGVAQLTFRTRFEKFTVQVRPDWWNHEGITLPGTEVATGPFIVDVKTAEDLDRFLKNRVNFGYDRQAALYRQIVRMVLADIAEVHIEEIQAPAFFFVVVFKTAPVDSMVFELTPDDMGAAMDEVENDLRLLRRCYARNEWPGSPRGIHTLPTPKRWKGKDIF